MATDRANRDCLINAIERFLDDKTTSSELEAEIDGIRKGTADRTIRRITDEFASLYPEWYSGKVVLTRQEWDRVQRMLLLLASDCKLDVRRRFIWSMTQPIAATALLALVWLLKNQDLGLVSLYSFALGCGVLSIALHQARRRNFPNPWTEREGQFPFEFQEQLAAVREQTPGFSHRSYPSHLESRKMISPFGENAFRVYNTLLWLTYLWPIVLVIQLFPVVRTSPIVRSDHTELVG